MTFMDVLTHPCILRRRAAGNRPSEIKDAIQKRAIEIRGGQAFLSINDLLYSAGLQAYLEFLEFTEFEEEQSAHQSKSFLSSASPISAITIGSWEYRLSLEELLNLENAISQLKELHFENAVAQIQEICLEELWQQVLNTIKLRAVKALLRQQCYLINFNKSSVFIAVRSRGLLKAVQRNLPIIKEAFEKCVGSSMKVVLVVPAPKNNQPK